MCEVFLERDYLAGRAAIQLFCFEMNHVGFFKFTSRTCIENSCIT